ncbi:MAG: hypothetical protein ABR567_09740, partial [Myxococcales bacterium]
FPLVNLNLGLGALQRNTYTIPILDWGVIFRPLTWPYFLPGRWSWGVFWFFREALLLVALAWLAAEFTARPRDNATALGALAIFFSGAMTWWASTPMIEFVLFACLAGAAAAASARHPRALAATAYFSACAFCSFYPPIWAPMLWIVGGLLVDAHRARGRLLAAIPALLAVIAGAVVGLLYQLPYLSLVIDTAYPGRRVAASGTEPLSKLVELVWPSVTATAPVRCGEATYLGRIANWNVCEASSVEAVPLLLLVAVALVSARVRRAFLAVVHARPAFLIAVGVLAAWIFAPLPGWFATVTLLRWSPGGRTWIAFGLACALIAVAVLSGLRADEAEEPRSKRAIVAGGIALAAAAFWASRYLGASPFLTRCVARNWWPPMLIAAGLSLASLRWIGSRRGAALMIAAWLGSVAYANFTVNPMIRVRQLFLRGPGQEAIDRALAAAPGRLADFSNEPGATLAAFGWPMLNGVQEAPDLALFRFLAPESPGLTDEVYNRYAHYSFTLPPQPTHLFQADYFRAAISPCSRRLAALWVNHLLVDPKATIPVACAADFTVSEAGDRRLWSRKDPVCRFGVATGTPTSALDFDFSCPAQAGARFDAGVSRFTIRVPSDAARSWAVAVDPSVIDAISCTGATSRFLDAHLVVHPDGAGEASCTARYLDSLGALRRLLRRRGT